MPPPVLQAVPVSVSPLQYYGVVVKQFGVEYNPYFKVNQIRFKCRCPLCGKVNKHGMALELCSPFHTSGSVVDESRSCDHCGKDYRFLLRL